MRHAAGCHSVPLLLLPEIQETTHCECCNNVTVCGPTSFSAHLNLILGGGRLKAQSSLLRLLLIVTRPAGWAGVVSVGRVGNRRASMMKCSPRRPAFPPAPPSPEFPEPQWVPDELASCFRRQRFHPQMIPPALMARRDSSSLPLRPYSLRRDLCLTHHLLSRPLPRSR